MFLFAHIFALVCTKMTFVKLCMKTNVQQGYSALLNCIFRMNQELLFSRSVQCLDMFDVYFCLLARHIAIYFAYQLWKPEVQQSCTSPEMSGPRQGQTVYG